MGKVRYPKSLTYPKGLTKKQWSKDKPLFAGGKETGIGDALEKLETAFEKLPWSNFDLPFSVKKCDDELRLLPERVRENIEPLIKQVKEVRELAADTAARLKKEKVTGKGIEKACNNVIDAATMFLGQLEDCQGNHAKDLVNARKEALEVVRKSLEPQIRISIRKMENLVDDIKAFAKNPTEEQFYTIFNGDHNGRGYTTACKWWDKNLIEFPELRAQCFKGDALKDLFPKFQVYGDRWDDRSLFEKRVNQPLGKTGDDAFKYHARQMLICGQDILNFINAHYKLLKLLNA